MKLAKIAGLALAYFSVYPVGFWLDYLAACRQLAERHGVDLRTLDKALWQHSKESSAGRGRITSGS